MPQGDGVWLAGWPAGGITVSQFGKYNSTNNIIIHMDSVLHHFRKWIRPHFPKCGCTYPIQLQVSSHQPCPQYQEEMAHRKYGLYFNPIQRFQSSRKKYHRFISIIGHRGGSMGGSVKVRQFEKYNSTNNIIINIINQGNTIPLIKL